MTSQCLQDVYNIINDIFELSYLLVHTVLYDTDQIKENMRA